MVTLVTAKVKENSKVRSLNKKKLKTYWHALYPDQSDYVDTLTAKARPKGK